MLHKLRSRDVVLTALNISTIQERNRKHQQGCHLVFHEFSRDIDFCDGLLGSSELTEHNVPMQVLGSCLSFLKTNSLLVALVKIIWKPPSVPTRTYTNVSKLEYGAFLMIQWNCILCLHFILEQDREGSKSNERK